MNNERKVDLLYQRAHGNNGNMSGAEARELRKYRVSPEDAAFATKRNISDYVKAADQGYPLSFYDWCCNNKRGDRRRKSGSAEAIAYDNSMRGTGAVMTGWLIWGLAIYWMMDQTMSVGACAILGALVSLILVKCTRRWAGFTLFLLPVILMVVFGVYL